MGRTKLTIELIPSSQFESNLRKILTSSEWEQCKQLVYRQSGRRCEICNGVGPKHPVECHERWSYEYPGVDLRAEVFEMANEFMESLKRVGANKHQLETEWLCSLLNMGPILSHKSASKQRAELAHHLDSLKTRRLRLLFCLLAPLLHEELVYGTQRLKGLIALCPDCHGAKHYGFAQISGKERIVRNQLKRVNNWDEQQLDEYLAKVQRQWDARNCSKWSLDISWIIDKIELTAETERKLGLT